MKLILSILTYLTILSGVAFADWIEPYDPACRNTGYWGTLNCQSLVMPSGLNLSASSFSVGGSTLSVSLGQVIIGNTLTVGITTRDGSGKPIAATSSVNGTGTILARSQSSSTTAGKPSFLNYSKSSGDIADGFNSMIRFCVEDTGVADSALGEVGAARAGADNTGDIVLWPATGGTMNERARVFSGGLFKITTAYAVSVTTPTTAMLGGFFIDANYNIQIATGTNNAWDWKQK